MPAHPQPLRGPILFCKFISKNLSLHEDQIPGRGPPTARNLIRASCHLPVLQESTIRTAPRGGCCAKVATGSACHRASSISC
jgi:hypothetical protein